jgi:hypothetical protein
MEWVKLPLLKRKRRYKSSQRTYDPGRNDIRPIKSCVATVDALCIVLIRAYIIHLWREESCAGMTHINNLPHTMDSVQPEDSPNGTSPENLYSFLYFRVHVQRYFTKYVVLLCGFMEWRGWCDFLRDPTTLQLTWWRYLCRPLHSWGLKFEGSVSWAVFYDSS